MKTITYKQLFEREWAFKMDGEMYSLCAWSGHLRYLSVWAKSKRLKEDQVIDMLERIRQERIPLTQGILGVDYPDVIIDEPISLRQALANGHHIMSYEHLWYKKPSDHKMIVPPFVEPLTRKTTKYARKTYLFKGIYTMSWEIFSREALSMYELSKEWIMERRDDICEI